MGGFNQSLQVFEYTELSLRLRGFKGLQGPELTVLHLESDSRFTLRGYLQRRFQSGFWYHVLFYFYPRIVSVYGFPLKLFFMIGMSVSIVFFGSYLLLLVLIISYLLWTIRHNRLLRKTNAVSFTISNFPHIRTKFYVLALALLVLAAGELATEAGKLWCLLRSPTRSARKRFDGQSRNQ